MRVFFVVCVCARGCVSLYLCLPCVCVYAVCGLTVSVEFLLRALWLCLLCVWSVLAEFAVCVCTL